MLGPLVVSVVALSEGKETKLKKVGVRDSKLLTARKRRFLFDEISSVAEDVKYYAIAPDEINEAMKRKISLNELEAMHFARLVDSLEADVSKIYLDSPDVISERFGVRISMHSAKRMRIEGVKAPKHEKGAKLIRVVSEHKADVKYPVVSCASIIAKVVRDDAVDKIKDELGMDIGSGYPSDMTTVDAIRACLGTNKLRPYIREQWRTLGNIRQLKIRDFLQ